MQGAQPSTCSLPLLERLAWGDIPWPKYKQVMDSVIRSIHNGNLNMGEKIPSINEFSEEYLLSRDTVEKAYGLLKEQKITFGLLTNILLKVSQHYY